MPVLVPTDPVERFSLHTPLYFENAMWRHGAALAWSLVLLLAFGALFVAGQASIGFGEGLGFLQTLKSAYLTILPVLMAALLFRQGGIDLSMGSVMGVAGVIAARIMYDLGNEALPLALAAGLGVALLFGLAHFVLVGFLRVPGFLATVPAWLMGQGLVLLITQGKTLFLAGVGDEWHARLTFVGWGVVAVLLALSLWIQFRPRPQPRQPPSWFKQSVGLGAPYLASSMLAGVNGILLTIHIGAGTTGQGRGFEQDAIIGVVLGGVWLGGRYANSLGAFFAGLVLSALVAFLMIANVNGMVQQVLKGVLLIAAIPLGILLHYLTGLAYVSARHARPRNEAAPPAPSGA